MNVVITPDGLQPENGEQDSEHIQGENLYIYICYELIEADSWTFYNIVLVNFLSQFSGSELFFRDFF